MNKNDNINAEKVKLMTTVNFPVPEKRFDSNTVIMGIGSCFAQEILQRLSDSGFECRQNPNGIMYNAVSMADAMKRIGDEQFYLKEDFFEYNGFWHSWGHHGDFSDRDLDKAVEKVNKSLSEFRKQMGKCGLFIVTPSSSVVYRLSGDGRVVANCHKVPNRQFDRRILSVEENFNALEVIVENIRKLNPECFVILTLSPVRHYPGELSLNARSKAHLLTAIHRCLEKTENCSYFPSYEIVLDELRDYRFYREDMLHINDVAVKVIFNRFLETYFDKLTISRIKEILKKNKGKNHRNRL